jgi:hypothetical protein
MGKPGNMEVFMNKLALCLLSCLLLPLTAQTAEVPPEATDQACPGVVTTISAGEGGNAWIEFHSSVRRVYPDEFLVAFPDQPADLDMVPFYFVAKAGVILNIPLSNIEYYLYTYQLSTSVPGGASILFTNTAVLASPLVEMQIVQNGVPIITATPDKPSIVSFIAPFPPVCTRSNYVPFTQYATVQRGYWPNDWEPHRLAHGTSGDVTLYLPRYSGTIYYPNPALAE